MIKGKSGCHAQLSTKERIESLATFTLFLKQLHSINETQALALGTESQVFDRTTVANLIETVNQRVDKIITKQLCDINYKCFQFEMNEAQKIDLPYDDKCLVHGDLYCRHLMFNHGQLTGIIDWGDAGINNKSVDLAAIWSFYPNACHKQFFELYGAVDLATWQYARFIGLYIAFTLILYGNDVGDPLLIAEAIDSVKRINADLLVD